MFQLVCLVKSPCNLCFLIQPSMRSSYLPTTSIKLISSPRTTSTTIQSSQETAKRFITISVLEIILLS